MSDSTMNADSQSQGWNYSINTIHSNIIAEIFATLDPQQQQAAAAAAASNAEAKSGGGNTNNAASGTGNKQSQSKTNLVSRLATTTNPTNTPNRFANLTNLKQDSQSSVNSQPNRESATAATASPMKRKKDFKKSLTLTQNSNNRMPLSHSLKNISKIKNYSSSNSLIISEAISNMTKREQMRRLYQQKSSLSESLETPTNEHPQGPFINKSPRGFGINSTIGSAAAAAGQNAVSSTMAAANASPSTNSKIFKFQKSKSKQTLPLIDININRKTLDEALAKSNVNTSSPGGGVIVSGVSSSSIGGNNLKLSATPSVTDGIKSKSLMSVLPLSIATSTVNSSITDSGNNSPVTKTVPSMIGQAQSQSQQVTNQPATQHIFDKQEKLLLKKYARYKTTTKAGSAVVRVNTLKKAHLGHYFGRQISLNNMSLTNKMNSGNMNKTPIMDGSQQFSIDADAYLQNSTNLPTATMMTGGGHSKYTENPSVVSSKISLFKKAVSSILSNIFKFFKLLYLQRRLKHIETF